MKNIMDFWPVIATALAGLIAFLNLKGDVKAWTREIADIQTDVKGNSDDIRELQLQQERTQEHRDNLLKTLDRIETRSEKQDAKMDTLLKAITAVETKLQERTKELHS